MGKPQVFSFELDQVSNVILFEDCSIAFYALIDRISGYDVVFHQSFDPVFGSFVI
jgi:hypothetical protein